MDAWWVIAVGFAGGFILAGGLFAAVVQVRRARLREARERERLMIENERRLTGLLAKTTALSEELKAMSQELINIQEEERKRISRELHDEVGQLLAAITLNLELMKKGVGAADDRMLRERIGDTEMLAGQMFGRIRSFLGDLRPAAIDDLGLAAVARTLLDEFAGRSGLRVEVSGELGLLDRLGRERRMAAYRLMQECLTNVAKHAHATTVTVAVAREGSAVRIGIADDGDGFSADTAATGYGGRPGMGVLGMRERMELVGGGFAIESTPGEGTTVTVTLPIDGPGGADDHAGE